MSSERKTEIIDEEIEDKEDFFQPEDNWDEDEYEDDEPQEREYCD
jgi:hypothetical protein